MYKTVQMFSILLVALALAPALAHALEFPGKNRLTREAYLAVQPIYYPGFTIAGGFGEVGGLLAVIVLLILTPRGTAAFWWTLAAAAGLIAMEAVFWLVTQPVNNFWLRDTRLGNFGTAFFSTGSGAPGGAGGDSERWRKMRDQWEYSHLFRAGLATLSFFSLVVTSVYID
jgi:hypothetical protein